MVHNICPTVVKRLPSVQVAGADAGEIMTDTAEGHLGEKNLMSVATTGPLINAGGQCAERPSPEAGTRIKGQNRPKGIRVLKENNHEKRCQNNN
jgi:hypothetical protein